MIRTALLFATICAIAFDSPIWAGQPARGCNSQNNLRNATHSESAPKETSEKKPASDSIDWTSKRISWNARAIYWHEALEWFAAEAKMPLQALAPVPKTRVLFVPKVENGNPRKYSLVEIYDTLNELLQLDHKLVVLRRESTLTLLPADFREITDFRIPFVLVGDLPKRGKTEIVKVLITLPKGADADNVGKKVKRLLGDFGRVVVIEESNQLLLHATVDLVRRVIEILGDDLSAISQDLQNNSQNSKLFGSESRKLPSATRASEPVDWTSKRIPFEMRKVPWRKVLHWLADETGIPFSTGPQPPLGSFTFVNPRDEMGNPRMYSLVEVFDMINEILQADHNFTLLRRESVFSLFPADEPVPDRLIPRIGLEELPIRGKSELVKLVVTLRCGVNRGEFAHDLHVIFGEGIQVALDGPDVVLLKGSVRHLSQMSDIFAGDFVSKAPAVAPPASPPPRVTACCGTVPRCRIVLLPRLLRR
jgi:hypothetical protein